MKSDESTVCAEGVAETIRKEGAVKPVERKIVLPQLVPRRTDPWNFKRKALSSIKHLQ
jgi:hypothetical protein